MSRFSQLAILTCLAGSVSALPQGNYPGHITWPWTVLNPMSFGAPITTLSSTTPSTSALSTTTAPSVTSTTTSSSTTYTLSSTITSTSTASSSGTTTTSTSTASTFSTTLYSTITSSTSSPSSSATAVAGKRGMAYNDASYASVFDTSPEVTWGYNWWSDAGGLPSSYNFAPMLWGSASGFTDPWPNNVANMLEAGTTHLLSFNEPDLDSQSNMTPSEAATAYTQYMQPYGGQAKLGAPAVTNGGGAMGLTWLSEFMTQCSDCQIDFIPLHWYNLPGSNADFKAHITTAWETFQKPIWITEFGLVNAADADVVSFLEDVLPWLDEQEFVQRYAYFMTATDYLVNNDGSQLSDYGSTFASYRG